MKPTVPSGSPRGHQPGVSTGHPSRAPGAGLLWPKLTLCVPPARVSKDRSILQVLHGPTAAWSCVCHDHFTPELARAACEQMGYSRYPAASPSLCLKGSSGTGLCLSVEHSELCTNGFSPSPARRALCESPGAGSEPWQPPMRAECCALLCHSPRAPCPASIPPTCSPALPRLSLPAQLTWAGRLRALHFPFKMGLSHCSSPD